MNYYYEDQEFEYGLNSMDDSLLEYDSMPYDEFEDKEVYELQEALNAINLTLGEDLLISLKSDPEVFEAFVTNCYEYNRSGHCEDLSESFLWEYTPEGLRYWGDLAEKYFYEIKQREAQK